MRRIVIVFLTGLLPVTAHAAAKPKPFQWSASLSASTSTLLNSEVIDKPQYGLTLQGHEGATSFGAELRTARAANTVGTDSEDRFYVAYSQRLKPFSLHYQVTWKLYPGTRPGLNDQGTVWQVSASRPVFGVNVSLGAEYTDEDYSTTRKSYGFDASLSRSLLPKLSGWISVQHKREWGSVDYTNTNIGLYYQATSKIGVSTSVNTWHAFAPWGRDHPTLSLSLSRRL